MPPARSTDPRWVRAPLAWIALLCASLAAWAAGAGPAAPDLRFDQAEFVVSDSETPPESGWRAQRLPDSWLHNHHGLSGIAWYRMRFTLDAPPPQGMALYVARVGFTGQLWLNGSVLNPEVRFTRPERLGTPTGNKPVLIPLPPGLFRVGENELNVRVQGFGVGGEGLWETRIAAMDELRGPWLLRQIPLRVIPEALFALMAVSSVFGLLVWWRERRPGDLLFVIVMALWTGIIALYVFPSLPMARDTAIVLVSVLNTVFLWALLDLFYRYSESEWRWYPPVLHFVSALTLAVALALILIKGRSPEAGTWMGMLMLPMAALRLLATVMLVQAAWRKRSPPVLALTGAELLWFSGHLQVVAILIGWLTPQPFRIDPASSLPLLLVLQYFFVERFVRHREQVVRDLQAAVSGERARILQDMHDGMGAQLITALRLAQRRESDPALVARSIEAALQDLRLIIDSLAASDQGLVQLLGNLRYRLEPQLEALGIRLEWRVEPLPELETLSPQCALRVLRVVQEALNNAIKHARAATITISVRRCDGAAVIGVADDGIGFDPAVAPPGARGLAGMRRRAEQLGARLTCERHASGGTLTSLHLPLPGISAQTAMA